MPATQFLSEAIDEEERVIDGNTDANERDDVGRIDGDVGDVGQPDGHADGGQHRADTHAHR